MRSILKESLGGANIQASGTKYVLAFAEEEMTYDTLESFNSIEELASSLEERIEPNIRQDDNWTKWFAYINNKKTPIKYEEVINYITKGYTVTSWIPNYGCEIFQVYKISGVGLKEIYNYMVNHKGISVDDKSTSTKLSFQNIYDKDDIDDYEWDHIF